MPPVRPGTRPNFSVWPEPRQIQAPAWTPTHPSIPPGPVARSAEQKAASARLLRRPSRCPAAFPCRVPARALRGRVLQSPDRPVIAGYSRPESVRLPFRKSAESPPPWLKLLCARLRFATDAPARAQGVRQIHARPACGSRECVLQIGGDRVPANVAGVRILLRACLQTSRPSLDNPAAIPRQNRHRPARLLPRARSLTPIPLVP